MLLSVLRLLPISNLRLGGEWLKATMGYASHLVHCARAFESVHNGVLLCPDRKLIPAAMLREEALVADRVLRVVILAH